MGGAARIWGIFFSSTDFDEISIFGLSKDRTFRIWSTLMNPEQFLILVTYLISVIVFAIMDQKYIVSDFFFKFFNDN